MPDIHVSNQGSIILLQPRTPEGETWLEENVGPDNGYQPYWPTALVEHRFADSIIDGMIGDGLEVE